MKALAQYIGTLQHSGGDCDGQPFTVLPWQRRFIDLAFRSPKPTALSIARGNGKSCLVAAIASATVDPGGPLTGRRRETVVAASSFAQARIIFEDTLAFLREAGHDLKARALWRLQDSQNAATVECLGTGARVRCIGSDPKRAHGLRPALALLDEPAQWEPTRRDAMLAAIRTGLGKVPGSRLISLGTRPASGTHWFGQMLAGDNSQCHAAGAADPPFQRRTWRKANPSLPILPSLEAKLREEAALARRDPEMLAAFKALRLNQGIADTEQSHLISLEAWQRSEGVADRAGFPVFGIDLGTSAAMSAATAYWPSTGALAALAAFPENPSLEERGLRDGVGRLYAECARRNELIQAGSHAVDIEALLIAALDRFGAPSRIVADRWREAELRDALQKAGVRAPLELRGQGFKDGGEDVRDFRKACLTGQVVAEPSMLLRAALGEAMVVRDPAGNEKLAKACEGGRRARARDDAAAATILAVATGSRMARRPPPRRSQWVYA